MTGNAVEVADTVPVAVRKAARIYLIDNAALPPEGLGGHAATYLVSVVGPVVAQPWVGAAVQRRLLPRVQDLIVAATFPTVTCDPGSKFRRSMARPRCRPDLGENVTDVRLPPSSPFNSTGAGTGTAS